MAIDASHTDPFNPAGPTNVTLIEVGPRDGLQSEKKIVPTDIKVDLIHSLAASGLTMIQAAAFVSPKLVPQMADADGLPALLKPIPGVIYNYLVLNPRGLDRAIRSGAASVEISASASETHSRKNTGFGCKKAIDDGTRMIRDARAIGLHVRASVQCAFGCAYEGTISPEFVYDTALGFLSRNPDMLVLADTTGMATPSSVRKILTRLLPEAGKTPIVLHLHDTRGRGLANVAAAIDCGVFHFDTSLSGMGGCPFVPGAAGNISTEKTVEMLSKMNISAGVDIEEVSRCSERLRNFFLLPDGP
jgi:hydroxymethylglutaryl-CoA lyase